MPVKSLRSGGATCSACIDGTYVHNIEVSFFREEIPVDETHPSYDQTMPYRNGPFMAAMIFTSPLPAGVPEALQRGEELTPVAGVLAGVPFIGTTFLCALPGDTSRSWMLFLEDLDESEEST